jgi:hypothetical protein
VRESRILDYYLGRSDGLAGKISFTNTTRRKAMTNYTKPEVSVLGQALTVIEQHTAKVYPVLSDPLFGVRRLNPAYDLDE